MFPFSSKVEARVESPSRPISDRHPTLIQSLEKLPVALMVFRSIRDEDDQIVDFEWLYANPAAEEMVGRTDENLHGRHLLVEMPGNREAGLFERYVSVVETGISDSHEFRYAYEDLDIWFSTWAAQVGDGFVVTFTEVTEARGLRLKHVHQASILRAMYEQSPFAACIAGGPSYSFEFANEAFEELVGRSELVGTRVDEAFSSSTGKELRQILGHVRTTQLPYSATEYQLGSTPEGAPRFFRILARPLESGEAGARSVQLVAVDVTELVASRLQAEELAWQLAEEEELYRATFTDAPVGIAHVGLDEKFLQVNDRLSSLLGYSEEELFSMKFSDIMSKEEHAQFERVFFGVVPRHRLECQYVRKDGFRMWATTTLSLLRDRQGRPKHIVLIIEDVSSLVDAKRRLEESNRHKDEFLAILGHELRNPLAALRSSAALFARVEVHDDKLEAIRRTLDRQTKQMSRLIDDLLDVGRISRGKLNVVRERVDFREAILQSIEDLVATRNPRLTIETDLPEEPLTVFGDRARLMQVCQNLLGNACKYTPEEGKIQVSLRSEAGEAKLRIRDTGVGLDPDFVGRLFRPFEQEPQDLSRSEGGLGLGLALSYQIMRLHGGRIDARSDGRGRGSEFIVTLPAANDSQRPTMPRDRISSRPASLRFLIVEDNRDAAELLGMLLEEDGHIVSYCETGDEAPEVIRRTMPQVVLCDIGLPGRSGYEVAETVRLLEEGQSLVMIALSGYGRSEDKQKARQAGFDGHLTKPVELAAIYSIVRPLFGRVTPPEGS